MNGNKLVIIDGNSLLFRAYYATAYAGTDTIMRTKTGQPTNAIFAFANMITKLLQGLNKGDGIFVGFDTDSQTFRKEQFADYKANRKPCPEELASQFPLSREMLEALGIKHFEMHGVEADDICGTVAKAAEAEGYKVEIYTSDKDYLQLVTPLITVNLIKRGLSDLAAITPEKMKEEFGFEPNQIIDFKGLRGDSSDNLPGIPGIGDKGATKLIQEHGSFDAIVLAAKNGLIKGKTGQAIIDNEAMGRECYALAQMKLDVELPFDVNSLVYRGFDYEKASQFAIKCELKSFRSRLPMSFKKDAKGKSAPKPLRISSFAGISLPSRIGISLDVDEGAYNQADIHGISIATEEAAYYESVSDMAHDEALQAILVDPKIKKNAFDGKKIAVGLHRLGLAIEGIAFDILLAAYLLDSSITNSPAVVFSSFGVDVSSSSPIQGDLFAEAPDESESEAKIAYYALTLEEEARKKLEEDGSLSLYENIEFPLSKVLAGMEIEGFPLQKDELLDIGESFRVKRDALEKEIIELVGHPFNVASPKQVAVILYDELNLRGPRSRSTSVEVLRDLASHHPVVPLILEHRKYAKLVSTYIDGLLPHIQADGKIHTCFNQAQTSTGRLSSSNPNLQNISTRDEESKLIRKAFHYFDPKIKILSFDYHQIELRVLAALSGCQAYIDVFKSGLDLHSETARKIFGIMPGSEVPHELRRKAKAINFAIIYGTTPFGLSEQIQGSVQEAEAVIKGFYRAYPEIASYLASIISNVEKQGYVATMFGRRRYLRDIQDGNYIKREAAKRAALNAPVQGTAADLIKMAMLQVDKLLKDGQYRSKMVLQIHDELLFAIEEDELEDLMPKLQAAMESVYELPVKLAVEGSVGSSWYEAKD